MSTSKVMERAVDAVASVCLPPFWARSYTPWVAVVMTACSWQDKLGLPNIQQLGHRAEESEDKLGCCRSTSVSAHWCI